LGPVFGVVGGDPNEFGMRPVLGDAFVIRTTAGTSDLLTDYHLIVNTFMQGQDTVELQQGEETFTAKIVAISPDPHVALLRIQGTFNPLTISLRVPKPGETVTLSPMTPGTARSAAVIPYGGPGGSTHLTFSVAVPNFEDGSPVLDSAHRVVGIAEPSSQFQAHEVGFAGFVAAACAAVASC
jgi:putative serine protease PepD